MNYLSTFLILYFILKNKGQGKEYCFFSTIKMVSPCPAFLFYSKKNVPLHLFMVGKPIEITDYRLC